MASDLGDELAPPVLPARRTATPPRPIFNDYQSAYQSILSRDRGVEDDRTVAGTEETSQYSARISSAVSPMADPSSRHVCSKTFDDTESDFIGRPEDFQAPSLARSQELNEHIILSRPINCSTPIEDDGASAGMVRTSLPFFNSNHHQQLSEEESFKASQSNAKGADGGVGQSCTIKGTAESYGGSTAANCAEVETEETDLEQTNAAKADHITVRSSLDIVGCGAGLCPQSNIRGEYPLGEPPNIELPSVPFGFLENRLVDRVLSEVSLYEDTEELLSLTRASDVSAPAFPPDSECPSRVVSDQTNPLNRDFSSAKGKGMSSLGDVSAKQTKELRDYDGGECSENSVQAGRFSGQESLDMKRRPPAIVYQPKISVPESEVDQMEGDARRAMILSEHLPDDWQANPERGFQKPDAGENDQDRSWGHVSQHGRDDQFMDFRLFQSLSSREVSSERSKEERPFRTGLFVDEKTLAILEGREAANVSPPSAATKSNEVVRDVRDDGEDDVLTEVNGGEDGEWETLPESGLHSSVATRASLACDASGSSLANMSDKVSYDDKRPAPLPWDPLRPSPLRITTPTKAVIHPHRGRMSGVQDPATTPRPAPLCFGRGQAQKRHRSLSSTLRFKRSASPRYESRKGTSPLCDPSTPANRQHHNSFLFPPPPADDETLGASFEMRDLTDKRADGRASSCRGAYRFSYNHLHYQGAQTGSMDLESPDDHPLLLQDTAALDQSVDDSHSLRRQGRFGLRRRSNLDSGSLVTPDPTDSYASATLGRTRSFFAGNPGHAMGESRRYHRIRDEMGCGTSGIVRAPGMQQVAPPQAYIPEELIGPTKPYRAPGPVPNLHRHISTQWSPGPSLNMPSEDEEPTGGMESANEETNTVLECPIFPLKDEMLRTYFPNKDGNPSTKPKAIRFYETERDSKYFEQPYCAKHQRLEFSVTPRLTRRIPKDDVKIQRKLGNQIVWLLLITVLGWPFLVFMVAWDFGEVRDDVMREYSGGACQTFHQKEVTKARVMSMVILTIMLVTLALVAALLE